MDNNNGTDGVEMKKIALIIFSFVITACSITSQQTVPSMKGFKSYQIPANHTMMAVWVKNGMKPSQKVRIYIDGNAKTTGFFGKKRPTVENPIAKELALKDPYPYIIYLGRTCYYIEQSVCKPITWEKGKYMPEIIDEMKLSIERLQKKYRISEIELVGYDGGGTIALLLATRIRQIPVKVITIAGIVNTEHYALFHDEELPEGSLNPADESYLSARIPQVHYVGGQDQIMPIAFTKDFVKKLPKPVSAQVKAIPSATHDNWLNYNLDF